MKLRHASALLVTAALFATGAGAQEKKQLAFVVNGASDFWKLAEAGVKKAQGELPNYELSLKYPEQAAAAIQQRLMDDLVAAGVDAIMVSAVDPETSTEALNRVGGQVPLFTTDCDAPDTNRIAYIGSLEHRCRQAGGRDRAEGAARWRQVHGLRRPAGRRQCPRAHRGHEGSDQGLQDRTRSTCAATTSTRRAPSAMSRTRWPPIPTSTAWSASTPTTRRASTKC